MELESLIVPLKLDGNNFEKGIGDVLKSGLKLAAIGGVVTAITGLMKKATDATFKWAEELDGLEDIMGVTNKEAAALAYVARVSGVGVNKLAQANKILSKGLLDAKGKLDITGKALKTYGINVKDSNGNVKDQATLIDEVSKKYGELGTQQERINFLTDIYGKQGADLIDFFDTLNSEGGVGTLAEKMEKLGLAIDPARYEEFNRNIERLKILGLSLGVAFTEELMPVLERFLGWITDISGNPKFIEFSKKIGEFVSSILELSKGKIKFEKIDIDFEGLSQTLIDAIDDIDWAEVGAKIEGAVETFIDIGADLIVQLVTEVKWWELGNSLASGFNNFWAGMLGTDEAGLQVMVQEQVNNVGNVDTSPILLKSTEISNMVVLGLQTTNSKIVFTITGWVATVTSKMNELKVSFAVGFVQVQLDIARKLDEIRLTFITKAGGWISGVIGKLREIKEGLFRELGAIVDRINAILSKILSPTIDFGIGGATGNVNVGNRKNGGEVGFASGTNGWLTVPSGFPNDSFPIGLTSGEKFSVVNKSQQQEPQSVVVNIDYKKLARVIRDAQLQSV